MRWVWHFWLQKSREGLVVDRKRKSRGMLTYWIRQYSFTNLKFQQLQQKLVFYHLKADVLLGLSNVLPFNVYVKFDHMPQYKFLLHIMHIMLQLLLERKSNEVGKLIKETEENITSLTENISQTKVNSSQKSPFVWQLAHKTSETAMEWQLYSRRRLKLLCTVGCITVAIIHNVSIKNVLSLNFQL